MKALILVLSARREPWGSLMDASRETWDAEEHPQTRTLYYQGRDEQRDAAGYPYKPDVIVSWLTEELHDVSARTIEAFELSLDMAKWDFIARPNSSCYVHKKNLVAYLETLPRENQLRGLLAYGSEVGKQLLWGGGQYIISRDVVEQFVAHKAEWRLDLMEDEAITRMAEALEIPMLPGRSATIDLMPSGIHSCTLYGHGNSFTFTDWSDIGRFSSREHHFFRCKQDSDRTGDVRVMRELRRVLP